MSQPFSDSPSHGLVASHVSVTDRAGHVIVDDVSVHARPGRTLVIVGESGAGKSMLARTLCALTPSALSASGTVSLGGQDYDLATDQGRLKKQRGGGIVWLPQDLARSYHTLRQAGDGCPHGQAIRARSAFACASRRGWP